MNSKKYMVDGQRYSAEKILELFGADPTETRPLQYRDMACMKALKPHLEHINSLLDVGCYTGDFLVHVLKKYPKLEGWGIDYYDDNIQIASLIHPKFKERFRVMGVSDLKFANDTFDCVTFKEVIEHIERPGDALREINRVLKPGGLLLLSTPNANAHAWLLFPYSLYRSLAGLFGEKPPAKKVIYFEDVEWNRHIYSWTPNTLATLLHVNGFEYITHSFYSHSLLGKLFPEMGDGLVFLVRKAGPPGKLI